MSLDKNILNTIGLVALIGSLYTLIHKINEKTETKLYSDEALKKLQDPKKRQELDSAIDHYHENGEWQESIFTSE